MTETLDGLFNPFYATSGNDSSVVSMTQIGMITTDLDADGNVIPAYGDNHAVVVKDMDKIYNESTNTTDYYFVIKNGIKFSDGKPLTMNDVLFNMYVYLDPVYTGSSTMYSTDIVGLTEYRTQQSLSGDGAEDLVVKESKSRAQNRINELITVFINTSKANNPTATNYSVPYEDMIAAINNHSVTPGYQEAISNNPGEVTNEQLLKDYQLALKLFKEELGRDYEGAKDSYKPNEPYKNYTGLSWNEVESFMYTEGYISLRYKNHGTSSEDRSVIESHQLKYNPDVVYDKESAINFVYNDKIESELHMILSYWATANELATQYAAKAMEVILRENMVGDSLLIPNVSGIKSLGHVTDETVITIGENTYNIARQHNTDGTPVNANEYDVLKITINGTDPKAIWNFAFAVAPQHYYAPNQTVDIANNKFGVEFGSFDFMQNEIQSTRNVQVPMGAGAYQATDVNNNDNPEGTAFYSANVVYFKRNEHFLLGQPKIEKIRYQVISASNAINALQNGSVHYISPQYTNDNYTKLTQLASSGYKMLSTDQLGYGYIGINAAKIPELELRKAIMVAMDTSQALAYYNTGSAETIYWPMSMVSWAYPKDESGNPDRMNNKEYIQISFSEEYAKEMIQQYMSQAGVSAGHSKLSIKFTIAGSNVTDHPTYNTFVKAAKILNECGWDIQVVPDVNALTKLSTGSLTVWAAA
jgi:ABC-type transport system substrate-binding protein